MLCLGDRDPHLHECIRYTCKITLNIATEKSRGTSAEFTSVADPDPQVRGRGGRSCGPRDKGVARSSKNFFWPFGLHFGRKIRGRGAGGPDPSPASVTVHYVKEFVRLWCWNFFPWYIYQYEQALCLWQYWLTLLGKPFIVGLPNLRPKSSITGPHTLMLLFCITFFSWMGELDK